VNVPIAQPGAIAAGTIPLGKTAARRRAENFDFHEGILQAAQGKCQPGWRTKGVQTQNSPTAAAIGPHN